MSYEDTQALTGQELGEQLNEAERATETLRLDPDRESGGAAPFPAEPGGMPRTSEPTELLYRPTPVLAWFVEVTGARRGKLTRLAAEVTSIGRDSHNDVVLDDTSVSRQHAKVRLEEDDKRAEQFYIHDLVSANGTKVNGKAIVKEALYNNDRVEIGRLTLVFKQIDGPLRRAEAATGEEAAERQ